MSAPLLELIGIEKSFGAVRALEGASLAVQPGEIHAILGENGAGKTTLVSIAAGRLARDAGTVRLAGREVTFASPRAARTAGLSLVPQHDLLVPAASVADNLALLDPQAPLVSTRGRRRERVRETERTTGLALADPDVAAETLGVGVRQRIAVAGALLHDPAVLILDEPTAVLAPDEAAALFRALRARAERGCAVVLITHRLPEVFAFADRLTLLSRGRTLLESPVTGVTAEEVAALLMGGAESTSPAPSAAPARDREAAVLLSVDALRPEGSLAPPVSLRLSAGDVVALLAIDGNGAERIAVAVVGTAGREGEVTLSRRPISPRDVAAFRAAGGAFVPGDRLAEGLVLDLSIAENLALASLPGGLLLDRRAMERRGAEAIQKFGIRAASPRVRAGTLSGGNQQKLVLARELLGDPRVILAVHPTRGLDLASTGDVRRRLAAARDAGAALLVVTADPDEARELGGVIHVVYRGALSPPLPHTTPHEVLGRLLAGLAA